MTVKELANKRSELTDIEIEDNGGKDLSAYDMKVGRKNTAGNSLGSFAAGANATVAHNSGTDISINDLIDFVNSYSEDNIQIDGKEKAVRNSAGKRIARTEEGLRAFYEWFGDSLIVDENGRPLVMYHGSPNKGIQIFDKNRIGNRDNGFFGKGFYFTPKYYVAEGYANTNDIYPDFNDQGNKGEVYPVFEPNQIKSVYNRGSFSRTTNGHQNSSQFHVLFINIHQTIHNIHYATKVSDVKMGVYSIDI